MGCTDSKAFGASAHRFRSGEGRVEYIRTRDGLFRPPKSGDNRISKLDDPWGDFC